MSVQIGTLVPGSSEPGYLNPNDPDWYNSWIDTLDNYSDEVKANLRTVSWKAYAYGGIYQDATSWWMCSTDRNFTTNGVGTYYVDFYGSYRRVSKSTGLPMTSIQYRSYNISLPHGSELVVCQKDIIHYLNGSRYITAGTLQNLYGSEEPAPIFKWRRVRL